MERAFNWLRKHKYIFLHMFTAEIKNLSFILIAVKLREINEGYSLDQIKITKIGENGRKIDNDEH